MGHATYVAYNFQLIIYFDVFFMQTELEKMHKREVEVLLSRTNSQEDSQQMLHKVKFFALMVTLKYLTNV